NACAVEIDGRRVDELRALPGVLRLERDGVAPAAGAKAQDRFNHNVDALHQLGYSGVGAGIAIVDSGFDYVMGSSRRPHRGVFRGGDPNDTSGPGLGGSRLLFAKQEGAMPAGAVAMHGTATSSVAAGGPWGTPASAAGNAYGADIAAYSVADSADTG